MRGKGRKHQYWPIVGVAAAGITIAIFVALAVRAPAEPEVQIARPTIEVGVPVGGVISESSPTPSTGATPSATGTVMPTPVPTPAPTVAPALVATPAATSAPQPAVDPTAPPPQETPAPPAVVVVAAGEPDDAVASFYRSVAAGDFDAAYSLWSSRMRAEYARQENLDDRFDQTAAITFQQLFVAERTDRTATVQANFIESYDGGGSREFIGYWRLMLVDGRWVLDEPQY